MRKSGRFASSLPMGARMRRVVALLALSAIVALGVGLQGPSWHRASAQPDAGVRIAPAKKSEGKKVEAKKAEAKKKDAAPAKSAAKESSGPSLAERLGIQFDLAWTGHYNGLVTGEVTDRVLAAV